MGYLVAFVGLPAVVIALAYLIMRRPVEWLLDRLVGVLSPEATVSKTLHLSVAPHGDGAIAPAPPAADPLPKPDDPADASPPDPAILARYYGEWGAIHDRFEADPALALRDAHAFTLELAGRLGRRPALRTKLNLGDGGTGSVGELLHAAGNGASAHHAIEVVLRGGDASRREMETAMRQYARIVGAMLRGE